MGRDMMRLRRGILLNTPHEEQASGAVASFATDIGKLKECVVSFPPVQDLHGYDTPWTGGCGENLLPFDLFFENGYTVTKTGVTATYNNGVFHITGKSDSGWTNVIHLPQCFEQYPAWTDGFPAGYYQAASGLTIVTTKDGAYSNFSGGEVMSRLLCSGFYIAVHEIYGVVDYYVPLMFVRGNVKPTAFKPYENVCPISGWDSITAWNDPKYAGTIKWNQLLKNPEGWGPQQDQTSVTVEDGAIKATLLSGAPSVYAPAIKVAGETSSLTTIGGHVYYMACKFKPSSESYPYFRNNTAFSNASPFGWQTTKAGEWGDYKNIVTVPSNKGGPAWYLGQSSNSGVQVGDSIYYKDLVCVDLTEAFGEGNEPTTVAEFQMLFPDEYYTYNSGAITTVSAVNGDPCWDETKNLNGTRYECTLDLVSGKMTVERVMVTISSASMYGTYDPETQNGNFFYVSGISTLSTTNDGVMTERFVLDTNVNVSSACGRFAWFGNGIVRWTEPPEQRAMSIADYNEWLFEHPINAVYRPTEPQTVQLTPSQLRAFRGANNVWSDTGEDTTVKFWTH